MFKQAEEALEPDFVIRSLNGYIRGLNKNIPKYTYTYKNPNNVFKGKWFPSSRLQSNLSIRYKNWTLNKSLLEGSCPKTYEFEIIEEPTVFIKVPYCRKLNNIEKSFRKIQYTDKWHKLNFY